MVLQTSGAISASQIATEFQLANPIDLSAKGAAPINKAVGTSISFSDFYGKSSAGLKWHLDAKNLTSYSGTGTTSWNDLTSSAAHATLPNSGHVRGPNYVTITTPISATGPNNAIFNVINNEFTIEVMCRPSAMTDNTFLNFMNSTSTDRIALIHLPYGNVVYFDVNGCCGPTQRINYGAPANITTQRKHYVFRSRMSTLPNRHVFENAASVADSGANSTNNTLVWGGSTQFLYNWVGDIYFIKLHNKALTDAEITAAHTQALLDYPEYFKGLKFEIYNGYFNDSVAYFTSNSPIATGYTTSLANIEYGTNGARPVNGSDYYSVQWTGFFFAQTSGSYQFSLESDDASYFWIGATATSGFTTANANINNGGVHGMNKVSTTQTLTAGTLYPVRIMYGENAGGDDCKFEVIVPGGAVVTNGTGWFFNLTSAAVDYVPAAIAMLERTVHDCGLVVRQSVTSDQWYATFYNNYYAPSNFGAGIDPIQGANNSMYRISALPNRGGNFPSIYPVASYFLEFVSSSNNVTVSASGITIVWYGSQVNFICNLGENYNLVNSSIPSTTGSATLTRVDAVRLNKSNDNRVFQAFNGTTDSSLVTNRVYNTSDTMSSPIPVGSYPLIFSATNGNFYGFKVYDKYLTDAELALAVNPYFTMPSSSYDTNYYNQWETRVDK
jgi:hypothetical protein